MCRTNRFPHIPKLWLARLKVRSNGFHLIRVDDLREDDLAFTGEVLGSTGIRDAVDELVGAAHRAGAKTGNLAGRIHGKPNPERGRCTACDVRTICPHSAAK